MYPDKGTTFFIVKEEKYVILEFRAVRNINKVIRNLRSHSKKVPWKVQPHGAFEMMNGLSCNKFLLWVFGVTQRMAQPLSIILDHSMDEELDFPKINITPLNVFIEQHYQTKGEKRGLNA